MKKRIELDLGPDKKFVANVSIPMEGYEELFLIRCDILVNIDPWIDFDSETIHEVFANQTKYMAVIIPIIPETNEEQISISIMKILKNSFEELLPSVKQIFDSNQRLNTVYYYFPDVKYILLIREGEYCCIDYGNYDFASPGSTPIIVTKGAEQPLNTRKYIADLARIKNLIKEDGKLFKTNRVVANTSSKSCTYCHNDQVELSHCSRCKTTYYCNQDCQRSDWPNHKKTCQRLNVIDLSEEEDVDIKLYIPKK